jgi:hypothetical protein
MDPSHAQVAAGLGPRRAPVTGDRLVRCSVLMMALLAAALLALASPRSAPAAHGPTHGPDAFGYTAFSIPFKFKDISTTGTVVLDGLDDAFAPVPIGFPFSFYGSSHSTAFVSTNALITFVLGSSDFSNTPLTTTSPTPDVPTMAVLWDDWHTGRTAGPTGDRVLARTVGEPGERRLIVQWQVVEHFQVPTTPASSVTFQAVLFEETKAIEYRYLDTTTGNSTCCEGAGNNNGQSATVGIRDMLGHTNGRNLQWSHNQAVISNASAVRFCPPNDNDDDNDGLTNSRESLFRTLLNIRDSDGDGIVDGNDDANRNGVDDEDEDDNDGCPDDDSDRDGIDDEDEDD